MKSLFVDESKVRGYTVVAASVVPTDKGMLRKELNDLRKPGQKRLHFVKESDSRRREILRRLERLEVQTLIYRIGGVPETAAREHCLREIVSDACRSDVSSIVIERDESVVQFDRRVIYRELGVHESRDRISYRHEKASTEPLLWIPDAVAWSFTRGGDWRRRIDNIVTQVTDL